MNYTELTNEVINYLENRETTFVSSLPSIIRRAEKRIYNDAQIPASKKQATTSVAFGLNTSTVPTDLIAVYSLYADNESDIYEPVFQREADYIRAMYPSLSVRGTPEAYAMLDNINIVLGPAADQAYTLRWDYMAYPTSIVDATTTWVGDNFESVLLTAAILEGAIYSKMSQQDIATYDNAYGQSLAALANAGIRVSRQSKFVIKSSTPEKTQ